MKIKSAGMPAGWGFRPRKPAKPSGPRWGERIRPVVAALLQEPAVLHVPHAVLCRDVAERFKVDGDVAHFAVKGARRLALGMR